jgi:hypothetical protein
LLEKMIASDIAHEIRIKANEMQTDTSDNDDK